MIEGKLNFEELRSEWWGSNPIILSRVDDIGLVCLWQTSRCLDEARTRYETAARRHRAEQGERHRAVQFDSIVSRVKKLIKAGVGLKTVSDMRKANKTVAVQELNEFAKSLVFSA
tara:strand:- start:329 stop:673 length:345 start_codon:yes stop_codon:yes gene_type:complete